MTDASFLPDDWQSRFSTEQLKIITANWRGKPPECCKGNCDVKEYHMDAVCKGCGWCEDSLPTTCAKDI
ncbi:MAG: hypothetical protein ACK4EY_16305 [Flavipsychrobacter sp.]